jgi:hypothetical protein
MGTIALRGGMGIMEIEDKTSPNLTDQCIGKDIYPCRTVGGGREHLCSDKGEISPADRPDGTITAFPPWTQVMLVPPGPGELVLDSYRLGACSSIQRVTGCN